MEVEHCFENFQFLIKIDVLRILESFKLSSFLIFDNFTMLPTLRTKTIIEKHLLKLHFNFSNQLNMLLFITLLQVKFEA